MGADVIIIKYINILAKMGGGGIYSIGAYVIKWDPKCRGYDEYQYISIYPLGYMNIYFGFLRICAEMEYIGIYWINNGIEDNISINAHVNICSIYYTKN